MVICKNVPGSAAKFVLLSSLVGSASTDMLLWFIKMFKAFAQHNSIDASHTVIIVLGDFAFYISEALIKREQRNCSAHSN